MSCFIFKWLIFIVVIGIVIGVVGALSGVGIVLFVILFIKRKRKNAHSKLERGKESPSTTEDSPHTEELTWIPTEQRNSMISTRNFCSFVVYSD